MIDSSKKRNSLVGVEVLSPYVIERRSKRKINFGFKGTLSTTSYLFNGPHDCVKSLSGVDVQRHQTIREAHKVILRLCARCKHCHGCRSNPGSYGCTNAVTTSH